MLRLSKSLVNQPVVSLRSGGQIAVAVLPIINPHNLKILGWWCKTTGNNSQVLLAEDVRETMPDGLAVNDESDLSSPEDLVRHKEILDINFELMDKLVKTKRQRLGKVSDFSYNDGLFVQKLYVARPLHKVFTTQDTLVIDREQIIEVTDHYILVRDTDIKATADELATARVAAPAS
ncbi:MAG TPA: hypothetical protein VFP32_02365 [Candidatus Saccharimonadales bacterium]|nr:hypothetical protein [Candidatus Saccharimonadales bacterium]